MRTPFLVFVFVAAAVFWCHRNWMGVEDSEAALTERCFSSTSSEDWTSGENKTSRPPTSSPGLKRQQVFAGLRTPAMGSDVTSVKVKGAWVPLGLTVDDTTGLVLTVDDLDGEDAETLKNWLEPIAERVEADILVTDDADVFKMMADGLGLDHQVGKSHVTRNTETLVENLQPAVETDADGSLAAIWTTLLCASVRMLTEAGSFAKPPSAFRSTSRRQPRTRQTEMERNGWLHALLGRNCENLFLSRPNVSRRCSTVSTDKGQTTIIGQPIQNL